MTKPNTHIEIIPHTSDVQVVESPLARYQPRDLDDLKSFAQLVVKSELCGVKSPADALVMIMTGAELGLTAMQSLRGIHVIKGRPVLSADMMAAVVKAAPVCAWLKIEEMSAERCTIRTQRRGDPDPTEMTWTKDDAKRAGLRGDNWSKFPQAMLKARCMAQICRAVYPDVIAGVYERGELDELPDEPLQVEATREDREGHERARAAGALWDVVTAHLAPEYAHAWRSLYLERMGESDLRHVDAGKLGSMRGKIESQPDPRGYLLGIIEQHARQADEVEDAEFEEHSVTGDMGDAPEEMPARSVEEVEVKSESERRLERREEFAELLGECGDDAPVARFADLYVDRMGAATLDKISSQKLGSMCRKLRGMNPEQRALYVEGAVHGADEADGAGHPMTIARRQTLGALEVAVREPYLGGSEPGDAKHAEEVAKLYPQAWAHDRGGIGRMSEAAIEAEVERLRAMECDARKVDIEAAIERWEEMTGA